MENCKDRARLQAQGVQFEAGRAPPPFTALLTGAPEPPSVPAEPPAAQGESKGKRGRQGKGDSKSKSGRARGKGKGEGAGDGDDKEAFDQETLKRWSAVETDATHPSPRIQP